MFLRELFELDVKTRDPGRVSGNALPPISDGDRDGGGEREGHYWFKDGVKVPIPKDKYGGSDWCMSVYLEPESFGLTKQTLLQIVERLNEFTADVIKRNLTPNHSGGRALGESILLDRGWAVLEYSLPEIMKIRCSKKISSEVVRSVANYYPLLQTDTIKLAEIDTSDTSGWATGRVHIRSFHKEDFGFGGQFAELMKSAGTEQKQQFWMYKKGDYHTGIEPKFGMVRHGYATYSNQYFITCIDEGRGRIIRDRRNWVRFPSENLRNPNIRSTHNVNHELVFYSSTPFEIPASQIQVWDGSRWKFANR